MANERRLIDSAELISMLPIVEEDKQISLIGAVADVVTMISECKPVDAILKPLKAGIMPAMATISFVA